MSQLQFPSNITSGKVEFRPRARLMKLIGGELVSDEIVAVMELVKNAYDADARTVTVTFIDVTEDEGSIIIRDDGTGMSLNDVVNCWMQPGGTTKLGEKRKRTRNNRRVLGEKGIGRFACDKLGSRLKMVTRSKGDKQELEATFDWTAFEHDTRMLSDVHATWKLQKPTLFKKKKQTGTQLRIDGLRTKWTERLFRKLCVRLSRLRSPFDKKDSFRILIESEDFPEYAGEIDTDYLHDAPHQIEAVFDGDQTIAISSAKDDVTACEMVWNGKGSLTCGPVKVRLFGYDLETAALSKIGSVRDVRGWLREWAGVSVYRDQFRVWPYGEPHDDWLRLDQRRVNNPTVHLSNNQLIGFVEIGRDKNPKLIDQTNREGIIQNTAFSDLRRLVLFVLQQMEAHRQKRREPLKRPTAAHAHPGLEARVSAAEAIEKEVGKLADKKQANKLRSVAKKLREETAQEGNRFRSFMDGYSELAAVGQATHSVTTTVWPLLNTARNELSEARKKAAETPGIGGALSRLVKLVDEVEARLQVLDPIQSRHARAKRTIDFSVELERVKERLAPILAEHNTELILKKTNKNEIVRGEIRPENFHRILQLLINNSLDWTRTKESPKIWLTLSQNDDFCMVLVQDNGDGIPDEIESRVFDPMFSGREGARGMGLTIVKHLVETSSGFIELEKANNKDNDKVKKSTRTGPTFRISIPRKRSRKNRRR